MREAVLIDVVRTPSGKGKPGGALSTVHPASLLGLTIRALLQRNEVDPALVEDVIAGCVSQVGDQAMNVARTAALAAGLPEAVPATTVDRQCGSSQQAVHFAAQGVIAGAYDVVVAGGVESMSRVRMGAANAGGDPLAPLVERYPDGLVHQGLSAELVAQRWKLDRAALDEYSARSHARAAEASSTGAFEKEIVPVQVGPESHTVDETIRSGTTADSLAGLAPVFRDDSYSARFPEIEWQVTAGNSSPLSDGASAALIMSAEMAVRLGLRARARFHAFAVTGSDPLVMLDGVIPATRKVLERARLRVEDIDAYEVNEAFAPVPLAWSREFSVDETRLNPLGGAIALGHPLGASGTRLLATLLTQLERTGGRFGLQTMCEGGGMANATVIERL